MSIVLSALQRQRRDTAANWTAENPTLLAGEIGIESDTLKWKVGDGAAAWNSLAYIPGLSISAYPLVNADISATAEIAVSKLANGTARQLLQTDAAGTGVEFASNIDVPGTLDVTGAATFDAAVSVGNLSAVVTTKAQHEETQIRQRAAFSVGTPGIIPFGVGPVIPPGMAFFGIGPDAYNPIHVASGSFC